MFPERDGDYSYDPVGNPIESIFLDRATYGYNEIFPKNKAKYGVDGAGGPRVDIVINAGCAFVQ